MKINTFLIGVQKSGTTSLYDWIVQHPDVYGPLAMKDYHFFSNDRFYKNGIPFFHKFYSSYGNQSILINGAVNYIYFSDIAAKRIYEYNPSAKLILVLRNPIDRAFSAYKYFKKNQEETSPTFEDAIKKEKESNFTLHEEKGRFNYVDHGFYAKQLTHFLTFFPKEQIKIILFDELTKNQSDVLKHIYRFLEIDENFSPTFRQLNKTAKARFNFVNKLLFSKHPIKETIKKLLLVDKWMTLETKTKLAFWIRKKNTDKASPDAKIEQLSIETKERLKELYKEDVLAISKIINEPLVERWDF